MLSLLGSDPQIFLANALVMVIALTIHEFSHAWSATWFGDNTARAYGRLTLNPLAHLDLMGSLLLIVAGFGWAKPVPINPYSMRPRSGVMWVSLAGPMSNFLMAALVIIPFRFDWLPLSLLFGNSFLAVFLQQFIFINLGLMLFNLLPIAPLDGEKIALFLWPPSWSAALEQISQYGTYILLGLLLLGRVGNLNILGSIIGGPMDSLFNMLIGIPLL